MRLYNLKYWFWWCAALSVPAIVQAVGWYQNRGPLEAALLGVAMGAVNGFGGGTMLWIALTAPVAWAADFLQKGSSRRVAYLKGFAWYGVALGLGYLFVRGMMDPDTNHAIGLVLGVIQPVCLACAVLAGVLDWLAKRRSPPVDGPIHTFGPDGRRIKTTPHASMESLTWVLPVLGGVVVMIMLVAR